MQVVLNIDEKMFDDTFGNVLMKMDDKQVADVLTECIKQYFTDNNNKNIEKLIFDDSGSYYSHGKMRSEFTDNIFKNCDFSKLQPLVDQAIERLKNDFSGVLTEVLGEALVRGLNDSYSFRDRLNEVIDMKVHHIVQDMKNNNQI